jgi:hypothetical protein
MSGNGEISVQNSKLFALASGSEELLMTGDWGDKGHKEVKR